MSCSRSRFQDVHTAPSPGRAASHDGSVPEGGPFHLGPMPRASSSCVAKATRSAATATSAPGTTTRRSARLAALSSPPSPATAQAFRLPRALAYKPMTTHWLNRQRAGIRGAGPAHTRPTLESVVRRAEPRSQRGAPRLDVEAASFPHPTLHAVLSRPLRLSPGRRRRMRT
jgi:hypothetical protein